jgi:hypothetical protein
MKTMAHEYFHFVQTYQAKRGLTATGPLWLYEGAARSAVNRAFASQGLVNLDQIYTEYVNSVRGILSPLSAFETLKAAEAEDTEAPYSLGYLAVEFLISKYGNDSLAMLVKFWEAQGKGAKWEDAFRSTFGMSVGDFYPRFEEYRRNQYPPYCGTVGVPIAQATPAPLEVRFINRQRSGVVTFWESAWTQSPNIPYTFCVIGFPWGALPHDQKSASLKSPKDYAGLYSCGGGCIILYMKPTTAAGRYTFAVELPDGRRAETTFEHKRE